MAAHHRPTDDDRRAVTQIVLSELAEGGDLGDIAAQLAPLHPRNNAFPGELLLDLAPTHSRWPESAVSHR